MTERDTLITKQPTLESITVGQSARVPCNVLITFDPSRPSGGSELSRPTSTSSERAALGSSPAAALQRRAAVIQTERSTFSLPA
ncbi:hypothetical protein AAFF_G00309450 [Aldrovandia affinis]|uniref:Uncharacterized protein n=1 Tax=Aldrovandia affinis TaxID=143900 RepID=A0AAD7SQ27_9TELE|nr:hypothetical protein AAFF_G00309450 [Aldrovandia affinis]